MNERIRELARRVVGKNKNDVGSISLFDEQIEKFAELIVGECAQVCLAQRDPGNLNYKPSVKFAEAVKQHFGVKN